MKFLEIVRSVRLLSGIQGTGPTSVVDASGIEELLVKFVNDAYIDVQSLREDWEWLEGTKTFNTSLGKDTYTLNDIFGTPYPSLKKYQLDSFIITDGSGKKRYLRYVERNVMEDTYLNDTTQKEPSYFTISPSNKSVVLKPIPNGINTISFRYQKSPEQLTSDAQVPSLPLEFHNVIVYKALEKTAVYLANPEIYRNYSVEALKMIGQLMRLKLPKKRFTARPFA